MTKLHEEWREEAEALKALADLGDNRSWYEGKAMGLLDCASELEAALAEPTAEERVCSGDAPEHMSGPEAEAWAEGWNAALLAARSAP